MNSQLLVLASTSPYRRELLQRLQLPFEIVAPEVDESPLNGESARATSLRLAQEKARAAARNYPDALIIGSDQVALLEGRQIGKPLTHERAVAQLQAMRGKTTVFYTALALYNSRTGRMQTGVEETRVTLRALSDAEIESYLRKEQPYHCAGSAKSEGLGITLLSSMRGDDPNALIGLLAGGVLLALLALAAASGLTDVDAITLTGGALAGVDAIMQGRVANAFCALRPPGHHAERSSAMGFCFFGNVALAADYTIARHDVQRVAIVDFDVHHGNGTQHLLEERSDVLFISLHEHPDYLYPGTGFAEETGIGEGEGFTINLPIVPPAGDAEYRRLFETRVIPALDEFKPQFIVVSAGFDAAMDDPLAHMEVTAEGFAWMTRALLAAAKRHADGRLLSCLEGGYDLNNLAAGVSAHVRELLAAAK